MKKAVIMCFLVVLVCCNSCIADESIFQIYAYENGSAIFVSFDGKMGLITQSGEIIVPAMFDDIDVFDENGIAITTKINGNECFYGLLNQKGEIIVENCFTHLSRRRHSELGYSSKYGVYYAENQTGEGYAIFSDGTMIKYPEISFSSETNYLSTLNTSSFFVNKTVFLRINEGWMLFGVNGSPIVNEVWEDYIPFPTGGGAVKKNGLWGIVNQNGLLIVDYQYTGRPQYTPCGIVAGKQEARTGDTLWGMISYDGKEVLPFSFNSISTISENRIAVSVDGKYGYLNSNFQWVILPQWEYASDFHNQIAYVRFEDKVCLINENGKVIISFDDYFGKTIYWSRYIAAYDQYKRTINHL